MNIHLGDTFETYVREQVDSGLYQNASEVVRAALRLKMQADEVYTAKLDALRREVNVGWEQMERGELIETNLDDFLRAHPAGDDR